MIINQAALSGIYKSFSTIFNQAFTGAPTMWQLIAMEVMSTGRSVDYKWLGDFPNMREWIGDRVLKDLSAKGYELVNKSFEATISVDRDDIEDDQIGVYTPMVQGLAQAAADHPDQLVFELLAGGFDTECYDGQYFFDTDHQVAGASVSNYGGGSGTAWYLVDNSRPLKPLILQRRKRPEFVSLDRPDDEQAFMRKKFVYGVDDRKAVGYGLWQLAYASKDTLNATNYAAARAAMGAFTNDEGRKLGIRPTHLWVPQSLEASAKAVIDAQFLSTGASNIWYKTAELVVCPWL